MDMKIMGKFRVVFVLILGIMALALLTWGIGKIYLELLGQPSRDQVIGYQVQNKDQGNQETILVLPEVRFWICQVGVFQNQQNALSIKEQLNIKGLKAEVIGSSPWIVGIGLGHSADDLKSLRQRLEEKGLLTIPKQIVLPKRTFRVAGNGSKLTTELLKNVNNILQKGFNEEELAREEQLWRTQAGDHPPKDLESLHQIFSQIRSNTTIEEQNAVGLSLFFESQRIISKFSGK